ncbi:MAG: hypothetical protein QXN55_08100 [Candidatus Nitrosotenuis sp.]
MSDKPTDGKQSVNQRLDQSQHGFQKGGEFLAWLEVLTKGSKNPPFRF